MAVVEQFAVTANHEHGHAHARHRCDGAHDDAPDLHIPIELGRPMPFG